MTGKDTALPSARATHEPSPDGLGHSVGVANAGGRVNQCRSCRDGECFWSECPQLRDNEPAATGRHCPLDIGCHRCGYPDEECEC